MSTYEPRQRLQVLQSQIDVIKWETALASIYNWAQNRESRVVCIANVHMVVTALHDTALSTVLAAADLTTPDGMPIAWMQRRIGAPYQPRISGPDLMWRYFELAEKKGESIFLYGAAPETLTLLKEKIGRSFPSLNIAGSYSPPFRSLSVKEDAAVVDAINASGAGTVWVSLGCPKQEKWM